MVDTCQAMTLFDEITSSEVLCIGSSVRAENSYARGVSHGNSCISLLAGQRWMFCRLIFFYISGD